MRSVITSETVQLSIYTVIVYCLFVVVIVVHYLTFSHVVDGEDKE